jgi:predicted Zn-dependent peptidase
MFFEKTVLPNGVTVVSESVPGVRSVVIGIWVRAGSRDEDATQSGISHFMEHMMFKGTEKRGVLDIAMAFDGMGAELNAFTAKEYTCYYARVLDERLEEAYEILCDMVTASVFADDAIASEREVVIEEIARSEDTPDDHISDVFSAAFYPNTQLGRPILGTREIVGAFNHDSCRSYHEQNYNAANTTVVAAGNIDHARLVELSGSLLGALCAGAPNPRGAIDADGRLEFVAVQRQTEQAHLLYGVPGISLGAKERYAAGILDSALGGPMSSRLFQEVREKRGLAYAVYASTAQYVNAAQFAIYTGTRPENLAEVLSIINFELQRIAADGITDEELARVCEYIVGNSLLANESTKARMIRLGRNQVWGFETPSIDEAIQCFRAVTAHDVQALAQRLFAERPTIAVISPLAPSEVEKHIPRP